MEQNCNPAENEFLTQTILNYWKYVFNAAIENYLHCNPHI